MPNFIGLNLLSGLSKKLFNAATNAGHKPVFLRPHSSRWKTEKPSCASALQLSGGLCGCREAVVVQLPDVLLQVEVAAEALTAGGTGEGLLVVVRVHVEGQVVDLMKGLVANGALVLLLPAVSQLVVLVVSWEIPKAIMSTCMGGSEDWWMLENTT